MSGYASQAGYARSREAFAQAEEWLAGPQAAGLGLAGLEEELAVRGGRSSGGCCRITCSRGRRLSRGWRR